LEAVTGSADQTARLWHSRTGKPIGPPLEHDAPLTAVGFSPVGNGVLTRTEDGVVRRWARPSDATGSDERFILWTQLATGSEIEANGIVHSLDSSVWKQRRDRLQALGGPSLPGDDPGIHHVSLDH
jgi:WD40 repeat protein